MVTLFAVYHKVIYNFVQEYTIHIIKIQIQYAAVWSKNLLHYGKQTNAMLHYSPAELELEFAMKSIVFLKAFLASSIPI